MSDNRLVITADRPDSPDAIALIAALDESVDALYPPESRYGLSGAAMLDPSVAFFIGRIEGAAVACGGYKREEGYAEIKRLFVRPECRGQGLGQAMLAHLEARARAEGFSLLRLETGVYSADAIALYERAGFVRIGPFGPWAEKPDSLSVYFEKAL